MKIENIETQRLYLRGFEKEDVGFAMSVWNDPEMGEYLPDPTMENMNEEYRKSLETLGDDEECCYLISESKNTGDCIGTCSFIPSDGGLVYDITIVPFYPPTPLISYHKLLYSSKPSTRVVLYCLRYLYRYAYHRSL